MDHNNYCLPSTSIDDIDTQNKGRPNETAIELHLFDSEQRKNQPKPTHKQESVNANNSLPTNSYNFENINITPKCQPAETNQVYLIQNQKQLKCLYNRSEHIVNSSKNTWPLCQPSTSFQAPYPSNSQQLSTKQYINQNGGLGSSSSYFCDHVNCLPNSQFLHRGNTSTCQYGKPQTEYFTCIKSTRYDRMENIPRNLRNINAVPSCPPFINQQSTTNQYGPVGNVSINIGNTIALPCGYPSANYQNKPNRNNFFGQRSDNINNTDFLFKTTLSQYECGSNSMDNDQHFKENLNPVNQYNPVMNVVKPASFQKFNGINVENILNNHSMQNLKSVPPCQPSINQQSATNQYGPLGNVSINIGNAIALPNCYPSANCQIPSNHYMSKRNYMKNHDLPTNQTLMGNQKIMNYNNLFAQSSGNTKNNHLFPNTTLNQYESESNCMNNNFISNDQNLNPMSQYNQVMNISKTINIAPLQNFTGINESMENTLNNPSIHNNNIKSNNVHVRHPGNDLSSSCPEIHQNPQPLMDQEVPLLSCSNALKNSLYSSSVGWNTSSDSPSLGSEYFLDSPIATAPSLTSSDYSGPSKTATTDDINITKSEDDFPSFDFEDWLNTIDITPLSPYPEESQDLCLASEVQQQYTLPVDNTSAKKNQKKRNRSKIHSKAVTVLKKWFEKEAYPTHAEQAIIAEETGLTVLTVRFWFQNRRQILKKRRLEARNNKNTDQEGQKLAIHELSFPISESFTTFPTQITLNTIHDNNMNCLLNVDVPSVAHLDKSLML